MTKVWGWGLPLAAALLLVPAFARADDLTVPMTLATQTGPGALIGKIAIAQGPDGVVFKLDLKKLPAGPHGFHVHENGECGPTTMNGIAIPAGAAGRHFDPDQSLKHAGPAGDGHLGDLPVLDAMADGSATQSLTAPRLKGLDQLHGKALIIHLHGDNYADKPETLGGGGARFACGVIP